MVELKSRILEKLIQKNMSIPDLARAMEFDPDILKLYLVKDDYPIPTRIVKKIEEVVAY